MIMMIIVQINQKPTTEIFDLDGCPDDYNLKNDRDLDGIPDALDILSNSRRNLQ